MNAGMQFELKPWVEDIFAPETAIEINRAMRQLACARLADQPEALFALHKLQRHLFDLQPQPPEAPEVEAQEEPL